jgi:hypothetical protein
MRYFSQNHDHFHILQYKTTILYIYKHCGGSVASLHLPWSLQSGSPGQSVYSHPIPSQPLSHVHVAEALSQPPVENKMQLVKKL